MFAPGLEMYGISPGIFGDSEMFGGSTIAVCLAVISVLGWSFPLRSGLRVS